MPIVYKYITLFTAMAHIIGFKLYLRNLTPSRGGVSLTADAAPLVQYQYWYTVLRFSLVNVYPENSSILAYHVQYHK